MKIMTESLFSAPSLATRIRDGFDRVSTVLKMDQWVAASVSSLNPTQLLLLGVLSSRPKGLRLGDIAKHLGVSQPTATDTVSALERKSLVVRKARSSDARVRIVCVTPDGRAAMRRAAALPSTVETAVDTLTPGTKVELLVVLMHIIREFQRVGNLPDQRICTTCKYFQPFKHTDVGKPHHCTFVNAAFGTPDLRIDCGEHETASLATQTAIWTAFETGRANLQANQNQ